MCGGETSACVCGGETSVCVCVCVCVGGTSVCVGGTSVCVWRGLVCVCVWGGRLVCVWEGLVCCVCVSRLGLLLPVCKALSVRGRARPWRGETTSFLASS